MRALFCEGRRTKWEDDLIGSGKRGFVTVQDRRRDLPGKAEIGFVSTVSRNQNSASVFPFEDQFLNTGIHLYLLCRTKHFVQIMASFLRHNIGDSVKMFN